jgi:hypothetical protein
MGLLRIHRKNVTDYIELKESNMSKSIYNLESTRKNLDKVDTAISSLENSRYLLTSLSFGGDLARVIGALMLIKWDLEFELKAIENVDKESA